MERLVKGESFAVVRAVSSSSSGDLLPFVRSSLSPSGPRHPASHAAAAARAGTQSPGSQHAARIPQAGRPRSGGGAEGAEAGLGRGGSHLELTRPHPASSTTPSSSCHLLTTCALKASAPGRRPRHRVKQRDMPSAIRRNRARCPLISALCPDFGCLALHEIVHTAGAYEQMARDCEVKCCGDKTDLEAGVERDGIVPCRADCD
jgi:hypothetical protein